MKLHRSNLDSLRSTGKGLLFLLEVAHRASDFQFALASRNVDMKRNLSWHVKFYLWVKMTQQVVELETVYKIEKLTALVLSELP